MSRATEVNPLHSLLFTDLYQLTMARAYDATGMEGRSAFELFFRELPEQRNFIVAAGLGDTLEALESLCVTGADIDYLRTRREFRDADDFLERLRAFRFSADVDAVREGTPVFPNEPFIRVEAPIFEGQLVETLILNQIHFQSVLASKAARVVRAAEGRTVVDFGSRRAHGADAALAAARVSYLVGADGTSNVLAGEKWEIPIFGTMAHSFVQAHDDEVDALEAFARLYGETTLLVDTYDTLEGVRKVIALRDRMGEAFRVRALRLDSGDLVELAKGARRLLDEAGLEHVKLFASSGLDEHAIRRLLDAGAPIDGFGVGTKLAVSKDAPSLDMAYKLVEYDGRPRMKLSSSKELYPGRKQIVRRFEGGLAAGDVLAREDEEIEGEPLLARVMENGRRTEVGRVGLEEAREHAQRAISRLPERIQAFEPADPSYEVALSAGLRERTESLREALQRGEIGALE